jgi:hypothetical protein
MKTHSCGGREEGAEAGGVCAWKRRGERRNSKRKEGVKRRKTNEFKNTKTDEVINR